jgi:hypothetical protein
MKFSPKAIRFIIEAIDHYLNYHQIQIQNGRLSEDEKSDLINDLYYLEAIKGDLKAHNTQLLSQR